jgi:hypothetical protein
MRKEFVMRSRTSYGALAALAATAIVSTLALGCGGSKELKELQTTNDQLSKEIADLAGRVDTLEKMIKGAGVPDLGVKIKVKGAGASTRIERVWPDDKEVCKEGRMGCPEQVSWHLQNKLEAGWKVVIREKASSQDKGCFTPPGGASEWTLTEHGTPVSSGPSSCPKGSTWEYDVILMEGTTERDRVDPLFFIPFI